MVDLVPAGSHGDENQEQHVGRQEPHRDHGAMLPASQGGYGAACFTQMFSASQTRKITSSRVGVTYFMMKR